MMAAIRVPGITPFLRVTLTLLRFRFIGTRHPCNGVPDITAGRYAQRLFFHTNSSTQDCHFY